MTVTVAPELLVVVVDMQEVQLVAVPKQVTHEDAQLIQLAPL